MLSAILLRNQFWFSVSSHEEIIFPKSLRLLHSGGLQCIFFYLYMDIFYPQTVFIFTPLILQKLFSYYFTFYTFAGQHHRRRILLMHFINLELLCIQLLAGGVSNFITEWWIGSSSCRRRGNSNRRRCSNNNHSNRRCMEREWRLLVTTVIGVVESCNQSLPCLWNRQITWSFVPTHH